MTNKNLTKAEEKIMKEFKKTKFAIGGGSSFECSDYEGMYADLQSFLLCSLRQQRKEEDCGGKLAHLESFYKKRLKQERYSVLEEAVERMPSAKEPNCSENEKMECMPVCGWNAYRSEALSALKKWEENGRK